MMMMMMMTMTMTMMMVVVVVEVVVKLHIENNKIYESVQQSLDFKFSACLNSSRINNVSHLGLDNGSEQCLRRPSTQLWLNSSFFQWTNRYDWSRSFPFGTFPLGHSPSRKMQIAVLK